MPESRALDYLYDTTNTVGSIVDHNIQLQQAVTYKKEIQPIYPNMFSKLSHYPSISLKYHPNAVPQKATSLPTKNHQLLQRTIQECVQGANKFMYLKTMVPFIHPNAVYERVGTQPKTEIIKPQSPFQKSVYVQTMYRESHAQTDPYSPEYIVNPEHNIQYPELLTLEKLTFENGLPAGVREIEIIERARAQRAWQASLPEGFDPESLEKRLRMMEKMELNEWKYRENEIARLQESRLIILQKIIHKRRDEEESSNQERVQKLLKKKLCEKDALNIKLNFKREKELRRLDFFRKNSTSKAQKSDLIERCAAAKIEKIKPSAVLTEEKNLLENLYTKERDLSKLEVKFDSSVNINSQDFELPNQLAKAAPHARENKRYELLLEKIWNKFGTLVNDTKEKSRFELKTVKPPIRASTPIIEILSVEDIDTHASAIQIQQTLRGKIIQDAIQQGVIRRRDLIEEVRCKYELQKEDVIRTSKVATSSQAETNFEDKEVVLYTKEEDEKIETVLEATYLGKMFDFYTKELVRLREEKKIMAIVILTERIRQQKEFEENGRRAEELKRREFEEEAYRQVMGIHNGTVDSYLGTVFKDEITHTSELQAHESVQDYAEKLNQVIDDIEERYKTDPSLMYQTVSDMVLSFLIPEVERQHVKQQIEIQEKSYLLAAQTVLIANSSEKSEESVSAVSMHGSYKSNISKFSEEISSRMLQDNSRQSHAAL